MIGVLVIMVLVKVGSDDRGSDVDDSGVVVKRASDVEDKN